MSAPLGRQTQGREPRASFESLESDRKKDVVSKTSRWSSAIEAALHESNPCFSSLSISQSSLASTSQLRFKEFDVAFDIQLKFQSSSCLPLNTCFSLRYLWSDSQSYLHIIPSHFESSLSLFSEEDLPISFGNLTSPLYRPTSLAHTHRHPAETLVAVRVSHRRFEDAVIKMLFQKNKTSGTTQAHTRAFVKKLGKFKNSTLPHTVTFHSLIYFGANISILHSFTA